MDFLNKLLDYYSLTTRGYEELSSTPSFLSLPDISSSSPVVEAIKALTEIKAKNGRVLVYGDYDCDGIMATSILVTALHKFALKAEGYIPSRYTDGYGLTPENVKKIAKAGYSLILTADNGVSASIAIEEAKNKNIPVIILDHHEYSSLPSYPLSIVHPDTVGLKENPPSAGLLAYYFSRALLKEDDERLLSFASLSIMSDSMEIVGYNKIALKLGIMAMNKNPPIEISLLTEKRMIDESTLAMEIVPKINAVGRIKEGHEGNKVLRYFISDSLSMKNDLAAYIIKTNDERKALTKEAEQSISIDSSSEAIVVETSLQEGMNGLLASRLLSEYEKPVAVFSPSLRDSSILVGSLRSKEGFNILKALEATKAPLIAGGGHEFAGGCSIKKDDLETFKKDFIFCAIKHKLLKTKKRSIEIDTSDVTLENFRILRRFGPFGKGNEAPLFLIILKAEDLTYSRDGRFLSSSLSNGSHVFSFVLGPTSFPKKGEVKLLVTFSFNEWRGKERIDLLASSQEE